MLPEHFQLLLIALIATLVILLGVVAYSKIAGDRLTAKARDKEQKLSKERFEAQLAETRDARDRLGIEQATSKEYRRSVEQAAIEGLKSVAGLAIPGAGSQPAPGMETVGACWDQELFTAERFWDLHGRFEAIMLERDHWQRMFLKEQNLHGNAIGAISGKFAQAQHMLARQMVLHNVAVESGELTRWEGPPPAPPEEPTELVAYYAAVRDLILEEAPKTINGALEKREVAVKVAADGHPVPPQYEPGRWSIMTTVSASSAWTPQAWFADGDDAEKAFLKLAETGLVNDDFAAMLVQFHAVHRSERGEAEVAQRQAVIDFVAQSLDSMAAGASVVGR